MSRRRVITELVRSLQVIRHELDSGMPTRRVGTSLGRAFVIPTEVAGRLGIPDEAQVLRRFDAMTGGVKAHYPRGQLAMAVGSALWTLSHRRGGDSGPLKFTRPGLVSVGGDATLFETVMGRLGRAVGLHGRGAASMISIAKAALGAAIDGGVPAGTSLPPPIHETIVRRLREWGIGSISLPAVLNWVARNDAQGVGESRPMARHKRRGLDVIATYLAPGAHRFERVSLGSVGIIPISGRLTDGGSFHDRARREAIPAGAVYSLAAYGEVPAIFIRVAWGGELLTGMPGGKGKALVQKYQVDEAAIAAYLAGFKYDEAGMRDREILVGLLFTLLGQLDLHGRLQSLASVPTLLHESAATPVSDRVAVAKRIFKSAFPT